MALALVIIHHFNFQGLSKAGSDKARDRSAGRMVGFQPQFFAVVN